MNYKSKFLFYFIASVIVSTPFTFAAENLPASPKKETVAKPTEEEFARPKRIDPKTYIKPWQFPGITMGSPSGYGSDWGAVYGGVFYQSKNRLQKKLGEKGPDGSAGVGFGLGNSRKYVGMDVSIDAYSLTKTNSSGNKTIGLDTGGVGIKVHKALPFGSGIAIGRESAFQWGPKDEQPDPSWYGSVSKIFFITKYSDEWFSSVILTAGLGNSRFITYSKYVEKKSGVNAFGAVALRIHQPVSLIMDWPGNTLNVGLSIAPFRNFGLFINPGFADVAGNAGSGARFVTSVSMGFSIF